VRAAAREAEARGRCGSSAFSGLKQRPWKFASAFDGACNSRGATREMLNRSRGRRRYGART
jgi:hypothetical protein